MAIKVAVNRALTAITELPTAAALAPGNLTLLSTITASASSTASFTSNINSNYDSYIFKLYNIHASEGQIFKIHFSVDGGSNYNVSKTTVYWSIYAQEDDGAAQATYNASADQANSTAAFNISRGVSTNNDDNCSGTVFLFAPSSTTFVKHFRAKYNELNNTPGINQTFPAGYCNTTSAIDAVRFECSAGTFDGIIKMYGVGPKQS